MPPSKEARHITFMVMPDGVGRSFALRVPTWLLKSCLLIFGSATVAFFSFSHGYVQMARNMALLHRLQAVNSAQAADIQATRAEIAALKAKLDELARLDRTLRSEVVIKDTPGEPQSRAQGRHDTKASTGTATAMASSIRPTLYPETQQAGLFDLSGLASPPLSQMSETLAGIGDGNQAGALRADAAALLAEAAQRLQSLNEVQSVVVRRIGQADHYPDLWPVRGRISSRFGYRRSPFGWGMEYHEGMDISAPYGAPIRAAASGVVVEAGRTSGFGNTVKIDHGNGLITLYGHQSRVRVRAEQTVKKGQIIGYVGSSGLSTGAHLHFGVYEDGTPVDPYSFLTSERFGYLSNP